MRILNPSVQHTNIISYTGNPHYFKVIFVPTTSRVVLCTCRWMCCLFATHDRQRQFIWFQHKKICTGVCTGGLHNHCYVMILCAHSVCVCTFKLFLEMRYFVVHFWSKIRCVCVCALTAKQILFLNHRNRKVVGGAHNVLVHYIDDFAPNLSGVVLCNPFIWIFCCCSFQNIPISAAYYLLHWNIIQPSS